jgi:hypothetical protein
LGKKIGSANDFVNTKLERIAKSLKTIIDKSEEFFDFEKNVIIKELISASLLD